jgi:hypothetical protein
VILVVVLWGVFLLNTALMLILRLYTDVYPVYLCTLEVFKKVCVVVVCKPQG